MIIGHRKQWQFLKKLAELEKIPHAFLFVGPEKIGKRTLSLEFIKLINCQAQSKQKPCQTCKNCRDIQRRFYPDLAIIEPKDKEIHLRQISELHSKLALRSYSAFFKAAIIDECHRLSPEAQSAFLKLLEEPKGKTIFILISPYPEMLLSTILSRVEVLKFYLPSQKEIENYLKSTVHTQQQRLAESEVKEISHFCLRKPGLAIDFLKDRQKIKNQKETINKILKIASPDFALRFQWAKELSKDTQILKETLEIWQRFLRGILISRIKNASLAEPTQFKKYSLKKLKKILELSQTINFLISTTNVNPRLALDILMLEL